MTRVDQEMALQVVGATQLFGSTTALDNVSLAARTGEFLTILGESGSGKTTLLRIISGLERATRIETLRIGGKDVSALPASMRDCTTVFQSYALFPHMSVGENIEYGLATRGVDAGTRFKQAEQALKMVRLEGKYDRRINQLSGGERQRVALARAVITRPTLLLLDEPLGALDEKLRLDMQEELTELHRQLGMTFVYITHSQEEALTMSDRILLMRKGQIAQQGTPQELFDRPNSTFSARFMGVENIWRGVVEEFIGTRVGVRCGTHLVRGQWSDVGVPKAGESVSVAVRAERLKLAVSGDCAGNVLPCRPLTSTYRGRYLDQVVETDLGTARARVWDTDEPPADVVALTWSDNHCTITRN